MEKNAGLVAMAFLLALFLASGCAQQRGAANSASPAANAAGANLNTTIPAMRLPMAAPATNSAQNDSYGARSDNASLILFDQFPYSWWNHPDFTGRVRARLGPANASSVLLEFMDYQCPHCAAARNLTDWALSAYPRLALEFRHFPLPQMAYSRAVALGAECAADQGAFWNYSDLAMDNNQNLTFDTQYALAQTAGVPNMTLWAICAKSQWHADVLAADLNESKEYGVNATPTFVLNGQVFVTTGDDNQFRAFIDQAMRSP